MHAELTDQARPVAIMKQSKTLLFSLTDMLFSPNRALLIVIDLCLISTFFVVSAWLSPWTVWGAWQPYILLGSITFAAAFCTIALGMGYYERARRYSVYKVLTTGLFSALLALPFCFATAYVGFYNTFGRLNFFWGALGAYLGITLFRIFLSVIYRSIPYSFTFFGSSPALAEIRSFCNDKKNRDSKYFRLVEWKRLVDKEGNLDFFALQQERVADIVLSSQDMGDPVVVDLTLAAIKYRRRIIDDIEFYSQIFEKLPLSGISKAWLIQQGLNPRRLGTHAFKRSFDIIVSLLALVLLSPLLALIALATKVSSNGPILFIQPRQGQFNKPFPMYKFRTMRITESCADASGGFTKVGDARVTWVGKIIRPLHLDELPQLLNILKGEMSIVGPRPEALPFARRMAREIDLYELRYLVRPGLTGHAQILAGYMMDTLEDTKKKLAFDLYYLCNYTVFFDIRIMVRTLFVVLRSVAGA